MKKLTTLLSLCLTGGLFLSSPAVAEDCCQWNGCWDLGADLLYWRACSCDWVYGNFTLTEDTTVRRIDTKTLKMSPDFGFRLFGVYNSEDGCSFTTLSWTYLRATASAPIGPHAGVAINVPPFSGIDKGRVSQKDEYNRVYLRAGHYLCQSQCVSFYTYAGVEYIDVDQKRTVEAFSGAGIADYHEKSEFYALGFDLGIGGEYELGCGFNLTAQVGAIAAIGRRKHRFDYNVFVITASEQSLPDNRAVYPSRMDCVPGAEARIGVNYVFSCGCSDLHVEIGYALEHYFGMLAVSNPAGQNFSGCEDVGFSGPYAKFQFRF